MSYPEYAEVNGKKYKINTDYRIALKCFDVINDVDIGDNERALALIYMLFGFIPDENINEFMEKAIYYLQCGNTDEPRGDTKPDMDFRADECYISASFMSDYHIDLESTDMHFWKYIDLIKGLTEKCILSKVREIRNYDLSDIKDGKTRARIIKAKEAVALPVRRSKEDQNAIDEFESLLK